MNQALQKYGGMIFDFMIITILLNVSMVLVFPFVPMVIGVSKYFTMEEDQRSLSLIFKTIRDDFGNIWKLDLFLIVLIGFGIVNIYFIQPTDPIVHVIATAISFIAIMVGAIIFIHAPIIIGYMKVTFRQLLYNSIMLSFGGILNFLLNLGLTLLFVYLSIRYLLIFVFGITLVIYMISRFSYSNLNNIKERRK